MGAGEGGGGGGGGGEGGGVRTGQDGERLELEERSGLRGVDGLSAELEDGTEVWFRLPWRAPSAAALRDGSGDAPPR